MINLKAKIPVKEEMIDKVGVLVAQARDILTEIESTIALSEQADTLWTREDVAKYLKCDPKKIPPKIPKIKVNGRVFLYKKADVEAFVESRTVQK